MTWLPALHMMWASEQQVYVVGVVWCSMGDAITASCSAGCFSSASLLVLHALHVMRVLCVLHTACDVTSYDAALGDLWR